ncbi:carboxylesterase family protein [Enterovirga sp. CN4-39]|uniref:carboxylesterase family protein n=1 Tax=Enterovirga sp. CN4-39 TaxID=3400910 RepID=UPI003C0A633B
MTAPTLPILAAEDGPVVKLPAGKLRGSRLPGVVSFKRVPYAANPFTAQTRFRAPQPVMAWTGVRDATGFGLPPPQPGRDTPPTLFGGPDDLTLNIWTPDPEASGLPVMVWLPGGAFIRADAGEAAYDGTRFAADGIRLRDGELPGRGRWVHGHRGRAGESWHPRPDRRARMGAR